MPAPTVEAARLIKRALDFYASNQDDLYDEWMEDYENGDDERRPLLLAEDGVNVSVYSFTGEVEVLVTISRLGVFSVLVEEVSLDLQGGTSHSLGKEE